MGPESRHGPRVRRVESPVTDDQACCGDSPASEEPVRKDARRGGFPADRASRVARVSAPAAEGAGP
jgi:hypothetical protein